jgi:N-acetylneuraminic acid mutarotase
MPTPRDHLATAFVGGTLYAVGGGTLDGPNPGFLSTVEAYDPATDTWTAKAPMPTRRESFGLAAANGKLYAIGGVTLGRSGIEAAAAVEEYDPAADRWTAKAPLPTPRTGLAVVAGPNGKLYAVGGYRSGPLATVEEYDPAADTWAAKASLLKARSSLGLAVLNGKLYAIGGLTPDLKPTVEEYDPARDRWTYKGPMPANDRRSMGVASVNGKVYAVGGCINGACPSATVDAFDPAA